jgi:hypothetical protein
MNRKKRTEKNEKKKPSSMRNLGIMLLFILWGASVGGAMKGQRALFERFVMLSSSRAHCEAEGFRFHHFEKEGRRAYAGSVCIRGEGKKTTVKTIRHGYIVENVGTDQILQTVFTVLSMILAFIVPSAVFYYLVMFIFKKE